MKPATDLATRLIAWHARAGRHDLPWQREPTPYRVWVSEVMLQQTQVATVIPYFERFTAAFPDLPSLAAAAVDAVLAHWSGLGYYSRARNLHRTAGICMQRHGGALPDTIEGLTALPGIGRSTAGAILALAHGRRQPILDGNVKRVLARVHGIDGWPGEAAVARRLWALAEAHTPHAGVARYTQAIMDLGATVCTRARPRCDACPLSASCVARASGRQGELPGRRPRRTPPLRTLRLAVLVDRELGVLLERRPPAGVWGGLWAFPELPAGESAERWGRRTLGFCTERRIRWPRFEHRLTHLRLDVRPEVLLGRTAAPAMADGAYLWYKDAPGVGLPKAVTRLLGELEGAGVL